MRSKAAAQLAMAIEAGRGPELASACGIRLDSLSRVASGKREPSASNRDILRGLGISESWTEAAVAVEPDIVAPERAPAREANARTTEQDAITMRTLVMRLMDQVALLRDLEAAVRLSEKITSMLTALGRITGATETNERKVVRHPAFTRVLELLGDAARDEIGKGISAGMSADQITAAVLRRWADLLQEIETS